MNCLESKRETKTHARTDHHLDVWVPAHVVEYKCPMRNLPRAKQCSSQVSENRVRHSLSHSQRHLRGPWNNATKTCNKMRFIKFHWQTRTHTHSETLRDTHAHSQTALAYACGDIDIYIYIYVHASIYVCIHPKCWADGHFCSPGPHSTPPNGQFSPAFSSSSDTHRLRGPSLPWHEGLGHGPYH